MNCYQYSNEFSIFSKCTLYDSSSVRFRGKFIPYDPKFIALSQNMDRHIHYLYPLTGSVGFIICYGFDFRILRIPIYWLNLFFLGNRRRGHTETNLSDGPWVQIYKIWYIWSRERSISITMWPNEPCKLPVTSSKIGTDGRTKKIIYRDVDAVCF